MAITQTTIGARVEASPHQGTQATMKEPRKGSEHETKPVDSSVMAISPLSTVPELVEMPKADPASDAVPDRDSLKARPTDDAVDDAVTTTRQTIVVNNSEASGDTSIDVKPTKPRFVARGPFQNSTSSGSSDKRPPWPPQPSHPRLQPSWSHAGSANNTAGSYPLPYHPYPSQGHTQAPSNYNPPSNAISDYPGGSGYPPSHQRQPQQPSQLAGYNPSQRHTQAQTQPHTHMSGYQHATHSGTTGGYSGGGGYPPSQGQPRHSSQPSGYYNARGDYTGGGPYQTR